MYSVDEALERILTAFERLPAQKTALDEALGMTLAEDVISEIDLPPFPNSSMDGFAVRAADVEQPNVELAVIGDIPAGSYPSQTVGAGQAMRIMTGAPMPNGADMVIPVEDTDGECMSPTLPKTVRVKVRGKTGDYVRPTGEDIRRGQTVLRAGRALRPADLGVLAGLGIGQVSVIRPPVVAILSTGDELLSVDEPLTPGKIRDMNGYTIPALTQQLGARVVRLGIARDNEADVHDHLQRALDAGADLILSSAGVSVGAFDVVKSVVESMGEIGFWKVNLRPGKPLAFGKVRGVPFLGLPGNPVSAMVTFDVFARPVIRKLMGREWRTETAEAITAEPIRSDGRRTYLRATVERRNGQLFARTTGNQSSGVLTSLVQADGLLIVPEDVTNVPEGTRLPIRLFDV